jgi:hypothetical protein
MATTPMDIQRRPYSIEPITGIMLPDGIFDTAIYKQRITCYYTNTSGADLADVAIYLESVSDPGIAPVSETFRFARIPAGASVQVSWLADFEHASPGKKNVSFVARAAGHSMKRVIKQIFVTRTTYDSATRRYVCECPEGKISVRFHKLIGPAKIDANNPLGPWIVEGMTLDVVPNPAYDGQFGDLPFQDPWWKVLGWIIFAIAALVAIISGATTGTAPNVPAIGVKGTFDETSGTVQCCQPSVNKAAGWTTTGIAAAVAVAGLATGLADEIDPWRRGQEATPTDPGERTTSEQVKASFRYPQPPNAGVAYAVDTDWTYSRTTNRRTLTHSVTETRRSVHVLQNLIVKAPDRIVDYKPEFVITATFQRDASRRYSGPELHAFAVVNAPSGDEYRVVLHDDGIGPDAAANDGTYTALFDLPSIASGLRERGIDPNGTWRVHVYAQDTNAAQPSMPPTVAATYIGGFVVASATELTFDPKAPCPVKAQARVEVSLKS